MAFPYAIRDFKGIFAPVLSIEFSLYKHRFLKNLNVVPPVVLLYISSNIL